ncbi:MAG: hypothetical protein HYU34_03125 [Candidatus Omnitrophica bacterium]|nr:hypothetical protein [Candidatus Omnitrophota bacterium]
MRGKIVSLGILFFLGLFLAVPLTSQAEVELKEGMSQGDFALWVVKAIGAQTKLPPAATGEDAIKFLTSLGIIPEGGWQKDEALSNEALASLSDDPEAANLSFNELVEKIRDHVQSLFDEKALGVFRAQSSGTPSSPA